MKLNIKLHEGKREKCFFLYILYILQRQVSAQIVPGRKYVSRARCFCSSMETIRSTDSAKT
jgi:hypothetical protein